MLGVEGVFGWVLLVTLMSIGRVDDRGKCESGAGGVRAGVVGMSVSV